MDFIIIIIFYILFPCLLVGPVPAFGSREASVSLSTSNLTHFLSRSIWIAIYIQTLPQTRTKSEKIFFFWKDFYRMRGRGAPTRESALTRAVNSVFVFFRFAEFEILFFLFFLIAFLIFKDLVRSLSALLVLLQRRGIRAHSYRFLQNWLSLMYSNHENRQILWTHFRWSWLSGWNRSEVRIVGSISRVRDGVW